MSTPFPMKDLFPILCVFFTFVKRYPISFLLILDFGYNYQKQYRQFLPKLLLSSLKKPQTLDFTGKSPGLRLFMKKAGDGNRTHVFSLEGWCYTIEPHLHIKIFYSLATTLIILHENFSIVKSFFEFYYKQCFCHVFSHVPAVIWICFLTTETPFRRIALQIKSF